MYQLQPQSVYLSYQTQTAGAHSAPTTNRSMEGGAPEGAAGSEFCVMVGGGVRSLERPLAYPCAGLCEREKEEMPFHSTAPADGLSIRNVMPPRLAPLRRARTYEKMKDGATVAACVEPSRSGTFTTPAPWVRRQHASCCSRQQHPGEQSTGCRV